MDTPGVPKSTPAVDLPPVDNAGRKENKKNPSATFSGKSARVVSETQPLLRSNSAPAILTTENLEKTFSQREIKKEEQPSLLKGQQQTEDKTEIADPP